jgi:hypothetical protein
MTADEFILPCCGESVRSGHRAVLGDGAGGTAGSVFSLSERKFCLGYFLFGLGHVKLNSA